MPSAVDLQHGGAADAAPRQIAQGVVGPLKRIEIGLRDDRDRGREREQQSCGPDRDDDGNRTGLVRIRAKSKAQWIRNDGSTAQRQPLAFDADARRIEMPAVFSGSELILSCIARPYYKADGHQVGCSLLLEAVQICRLVGPRSGGAADTAEGHGFAPQRRR